MKMFVGCFENIKHLELMYIFKISTSALNVKQNANKSQGLRLQVKILFSLPVLEDDKGPAEKG